MRIAVLQSHDEILILQVKGSKRDISSIDGFDHYFASDMGRNIEDYDVILTHIGSEEGLSISTELVSEPQGRSCDISEWIHGYCGSCSVRIAKGAHRCEDCESIKPQNYTAPDSI